MNRKPESVQHSNHLLSTPGKWDTIITIYRHVIIHAQCQQVAHWHSKIWKTWHRETGEIGRWELKGYLGGKDKTKKRTAACFGCFSSREAEKESQRKSWAERHWGTIRHHNNTHAGQEKSISISLTQKSTYGCNFIFFLNVHFPPPPPPHHHLYHCLTSNSLNVV